MEENLDEEKMVALKVFYSKFRLACDPFCSNSLTQNNAVRILEDREYINKWN
jgi:hypothetical protein